MISGSQKIVVVGSGIAGIYAAHKLSQKHDVTLIEKEKRLGGHTNTVVLEDGPDKGTPIDTGFIVFNKPNYPRFSSFLQELKVAHQESDMSFSFHSKESGMEYAGSLCGLFAQTRLLFDWQHWRMIFEILKFEKLCINALQNDQLKNLSIHDALQRWNLSQRFQEAYIYPMAASIWSTDQKSIKDFPAEQMLKFFMNHFLLQVSGRPKWRTVTGGSHSYLKAFEQSFKGQIIKGKAVEKIRREAESVEVRLIDSSAIKCDQVVIATHADQILKILEAPTRSEQDLFSKWRYSSNETILHTDENLLPKRNSVRSAWNYIEWSKEHSQQKLSLSYWMNKLQKVQSKKNYIVSLNSKEFIRQDLVIKEILYQHPIFESESLATQEKILSIQSENRTFYCGSYLGNGFHEDAVASSSKILKTLGCHR